MDPTVKIGKFCTIAEDVQLGTGVVIHGFANLYGCRIEEGVRIGTFVEIQKDVVIGKHSRVQSHTFICSYVVLEEEVFVGHNVSFINDRYPTTQKAANQEWVPESTRVGKGASIGTGSVILCGVEIGEGAVVGAGSVVTHNVPSHTIVAGVPARVLRKLTPEERSQGGGPIC